ncbi:hypothetical protein [Celeribacter litoreus]|uniref:hypothetical protein n=1 Tax=Celeribacter litoreus TaxID=2876714 RepID=UPI001CCDC24B|nr:hypothetical protein [Celeribacter litoreus]
MVEIVQFGNGCAEVRKFPPNATIFSDKRFIIEQFLKIWLSCAIVILAWLRKFFSFLPQPLFFGCTFWVGVSR